MYYVYEHCTYTTTHCQVPLPCGKRGNTYGLLGQTNLYKLQIFYLLNSYAFTLRVYNHIQYDDI